MTSWILVMFLSYDRSGSIPMVHNLKSADECQRVAKVMKEWAPAIKATKCVEVIHSEEGGRKWN